LNLKKNKGLANSVIEGVTEIVNRHGKIIVLEDDLIVAKGFLKYMNEGLRLYEDENSVMQISGHSFPIKESVFNHSSLFIPMTTSWGWGTWKKRWSSFDVNANGYEILKTDESVRYKFDLENSYPYSSMLIAQMESDKINSWAIRWWWYVFNKNGIALFPDKSLVMNIGFDPEGSHTKGHNPFQPKGFDMLYYINHFPVSIAINTAYFEKIKKCLLQGTAIKRIWLCAKLSGSKKDHR